MSFMIGTVKCQCANVMGMPTDSGECEECGEKKSFWGDRTLSRLEIWASEHSKQHELDCDTI
jgi:hypothetical protein